MTINRLFGVMILTAQCVGPIIVSAQQTRPETTVNGVLTYVRTTRHPEFAASALRQLAQTSAQDRDDLADSLVAIALLSDKSPAIHMAKFNAISALRAAGSPSPTAKGIRYLGAQLRLFRIIDTATDVSAVNDACFAIATWPDNVATLAELRKLATSDRSTAYIGVGALAAYMTPTEVGVAELRRLYESGLIREPKAKEYATDSARRKGWRN